jgi:hypothetical protein
VAARTLVAAELVRALVTVSTDVVEASEVRPLVTGKATGLGVPTGKDRRVHGKLGFVPTLDRRMTVAATEGSGDVVRANVATAAVSRLNVEILLFVTVEARSHRTDRVACGSVEAVAHRAVAPTAWDGCRRLQNSLMRDVHKFSGGRMLEVSVT